MYVIFLLFKTLQGSLPKQFKTSFNDVKTLKTFPLCSCLDTRFFQHTRSQPFHRTLSGCKDKISKLTTELKLDSFTSSNYPSLT